MKAIIFSLLGWMMLPVMDGFAKFLSSDLPVLQITWARYFFTVAFTLPVISEELELPLSTQISHVLPLLEPVMHLNAYAVDDTSCRWSEEFEAQMRVCATPSQSIESIRYTCPSCGLRFASRRTVQPIAGLCRRCAEN